MKKLYSILLCVVVALTSIATAQENAGVATNYPGYLNVNILDVETGELAPVAVNESNTITITKYGDGTCDFLLPNFTLSAMELSLGDILVEGATVTTDEAGVETYAGFVKDMPLLGGELIADVTLNGTIKANGVVDMKIDVLWMGTPIACTFTTNEVVPSVVAEYPGYLNVNILDLETNELSPVAVNEANTITITKYGDGTCDFLLPNFTLSAMEMTLGDILVEGATVTTDEAGVETYVGFVKDMPLLGGELIADVTLNGTITAEGVVDMKIDVLWMGIPIECTFTTNEVVPSVVAEYPGFLNVNILDVETGELSPVAENEANTITITKYGDGTCDFLLPNFTLSAMGMTLGDILVEGATVTTDESGVETYAGFVKDMPLLGGELIADVTLNGTITAEGVVDMKIDVLWMGIPIECTFTSTEKSGVENIEIIENSSAVYYNLQGVKVGYPENGVFIRVQGGKASKVVM